MYQVQTRVVDGVECRVLHGLGQESSVSGVNLNYLDCASLKVDGEFAILASPNLKSLKGAPKSCDSLAAERSGLTELNCAHTTARVLLIEGNQKLTSLAGAPKGLTALNAQRCGLTSLGLAGKQLATLRVTGNPLTSLRGGPAKVEVYSAQECELTELGCPELEVDVFLVDSNKKLTSLKGGPRRALQYNAARCGLRELGCPELVADSLDVHANWDLVDLRGCPTVNELTVDEEMPALFAAGKVKTLEMWVSGAGTYPLTIASSVFRAKLGLIRAGVPKMACITRNP